MGLAQADFEVRSMEGITLPEVVGVGFGKGEARLRRALTGGFEQVVTVDDAAKGVGRDLRADQKGATLRVVPLSERTGASVMP